MVAPERGSDALPATSPAGASPSCLATDNYDLPAAMTKKALVGTADSGRAVLDLSVGTPTHEV